MTTSVAPKRPSVETQGRGSFYPYYAGFSYDWARSKLQEAELGPQAVVLDPFAGAGTTCVAANSLSLRSVAIDINPAVIEAAKARCVPMSTVALLKGLQIGRAKTSAAALGEPWLNSISAGHFGSIAAALRESAANRAPDVQCAAQLKSVANVVLFHALRELTASFQGSNPTWVKRPKDGRSKLRLSKALIRETVTKFLERSLSILQTQPVTEHPGPMFLRASSQELPLADGVIDFVLTSPPYCTRIDYAVATSRELAVLGFDAVKLDALRRSIIGTTCNARMNFEEKNDLPASAQTLLSRILNHKSARATSYYHRQFLQYFCSMAASTKEITRVLGKGGRAVLVVQDSFFQEHHVRLANIMIEMMCDSGLTCLNVDEIPLKKSLIAINPRAKGQQKRLVSEFTLTFER